MKTSKKNDSTTGNTESTEKDRKRESQTRAKETEKEEAVFISKSYASSIYP